VNHRRNIALSLALKCTQARSFDNVETDRPDVATSSDPVEEEEEEMAGPPRAMQEEEEEPDEPEDEEEDDSDNREDPAGLDEGDGFVSQRLLGPTSRRDSPVYDLSIRVMGVLGMGGGRYRFIA